MQLACLGSVGCGAGREGSARGGCLGWFWCFGVFCVVGFCVSEALACFVRGRASFVVCGQSRVALLSPYSCSCVLVALIPTPMPRWHLAVRLQLCCASLSLALRHMRRLDVTFPVHLLSTLRHKDQNHELFLPCKGPPCVLNTYLEPEFEADVAIGFVVSHTRLGFGYCCFFTDGHGRAACSTRETWVFFPRPHPSDAESQTAAGIQAGISTRRPKRDEKSSFCRIFVVGRRLTMSFSRPCLLFSHGRKCQLEM